MIDLNFVRLLVIFDGASFGPGARLGSCSWSLTRVLSLLFGLGLVSSLQGVCGPDDRDNED